MEKDYSLRPEFILELQDKLSEMMLITKTEGEKKLICGFSKQIYDIIQNSL